MKRRDFVIGAVTVAGTLPIVRTALGQVPCPPPTFSALGGTSGTSGSCGDDPPSPGSLIQVERTPEQIALYTDASSYDATAYAILEYKLASASTWAQGHPLYRVRPGTTDDAFAGCIFDLQPGQAYDVRVTVTDGSGSVQQQGQFSTRQLPADVSQRTPNATPSSISALMSAIATASPGDVIELQDGIYNLTSTIGINVSGTAANPIYIRGQSQDGVIVNAQQNRAFSVFGDHIVLENMTIDGGWPTNQQGLNISIMLGNTGPTVTVTGITIRDIVMTNAVRAVQTSGGTSGTYAHDCLIYNNDFTGTLEWSNANLLANTWNNDGIRLVGHGNCVWNNNLEGFSDTITFAHSVDESSVELQCNYAYRNFIRNSLNDTFELDHCERFTGVYDNYIENCDTGISQSDNVTVPNYGPSYVFRNIWVNVSVTWIKFNDDWEGWHYYNNTIVITKGAPGDLNENAAFRQGSPSGLGNDRYSYRNNIHIARHAVAGSFLEWRMVLNGDKFEFSHNAWFPDTGSIQFKDLGPNYTSANAVSQGIAATNTHDTLYPAGAGLSGNNRYMQFDKVCESNPFANTLTLNASSVPGVTGRTTLEIDSGSVVKNAGVAIPGITDGYSGAAPDMGALINGRQLPNWGAQ